MTDIKVMVSAGYGELLSLTIPQGEWMENTNEMHWYIHCMINEAMRRAQMDLAEEYDYQRWIDSALQDDDEDEDEYWREIA